MAYNIPIREAIGEKMSASNPPKAITAKSGEAYTRTYMSYDYGRDAKHPVIAEALFELQICQGVLKRNKKGALKLNLNITDQGDLQGMTQVNRGMAYVVNKHKDLFGLFHFDPERPGDLRGIFFYPRTETGKLIEGALPIVSLKHNDKTKYIYPKLVTNPDGTPKILRNPDGTPALDIEGKEQPEYDLIPLDYEKLEGKKLTCGVVINVRDLYRSNGTPVPQVFVRSCMVLAAAENGEVEHDKSQMVRSYLAQNPALLNTLAEQIDKMKKAQATNLFDKPAGQQSPAPTPQPAAALQAAGPVQSAPAQLQRNPVPMPQLPQMPIPQMSAPPQPSPAPPQYTPSNTPQYPPLATPQFVVAPQTTPSGTLDLNAFIQQQTTPGFAVTRM